MWKAYNFSQNRYIKSAPVLLIECRKYPNKSFTQFIQKIIISERLLPFTAQYFKMDKGVKTNVPLESKIVSDRYRRLMLLRINSCSRLKFRYPVSWLSLLIQLFSETSMYVPTFVAFSLMQYVSTLKSEQQNRLWRKVVSEKRPIEPNLSNQQRLVEKRRERSYLMRRRLKTSNFGYYWSRCKVRKRLILKLLTLI